MKFFRTLLLGLAWLAVVFGLTFIGLTRADAGCIRVCGSSSHERDHGDRDKAEHRDSDSGDRDHESDHRDSDDHERRRHESHDRGPQVQPCRNEENKPCPCPPTTGHHRPPTTVPKHSTPSTTTTSTTSTTVTPPSTPTTSPPTPPTLAPPSDTSPPTPLPAAVPAGSVTATPELAFGGSSSGRLAGWGFALGAFGLVALAESYRRRVNLDTERSG